jgi:DNA-binding beta-propeller fold protein YncE
MYEAANGTLRVTDVLANNFGATTTFNVVGAAGIHQLTRHNGSLYAAALSSGGVFRIDFDANNNPVSSTQVATVNAAIGVGFSPDGQEMYVSGHTTNSISRFLLTAGTWVPNGSIATGQNMGYIAVVPVPEPAWTLLAPLAGLASLLWCRPRPA